MVQSMLKFELKFAAKPPPHLRVNNAKSTAAMFEGKKKLDAIRHLDNLSTIKNG